MMDFKVGKIGRLLIIFGAAVLLSHSKLRADDLLLGNLTTLSTVNSGPVTLTTQRAITFSTASAFDVKTVALTLHDYISTADTAVLTFQLGTSAAPSGIVYGSLTAPASASDAAGHFVFTTPGIVLAPNAPGEFYWLIIEATQGAFQWIRSNPPVAPQGTATFGQQEISRTSGGSWTVGTSGAHSFAINGTAVSPVPEPGSTALLGGGLALLWAVHRRRMAKFS